jgi:ABC-2 type transport system permease protein
MGHTAFVRRSDPASVFIRNAGLVAGREYGIRVRSRAFAVSTLVLAVAAIMSALIPIAMRVLEREAVIRVAASAPDERTTDLTVRAIDIVLNAGARLDPSSSPPYEVRSVDPADLAAAREDVARGALDGLLVLTHGPGGRLDFEYVTASPAGRAAVLFQLVAVAVAASIRADEARGLVGEFIVTDAVPGDGQAGAEVDVVGRQVLATILVVVVFLTSVTYGMWIAGSVVEEKASRVMEVMLNAATPGEMLSGKVLGVGAAGLTQLAAIVLPAGAAMSLQAPLADLVLGPGMGEIPLGGLTVDILVAFAVFFLLGFVLTALVYAAAGSLVSRQEDVQQVAMPMLVVSFVAYFAAFFASADPTAPWVAPLSWLPVFSPYLMLTRLVVGEVAAWEVALAVWLLGVAIAVALVAAARIYAAGVLLYGQQPTVRSVLRAARGQ